MPIKWLAKMDKIANIPGLVRLIQNDSLGGGNRTPVSFLRSLFTTRPDIEPENFDLCPVLLAQPAADMWTTLEASQPFFDRIKGEKKLVMLENCGHFPLEEPGSSMLEEVVCAFLHDVT